MKIPFSPPYIDETVKREVIESLESGWITTGPKVKALEQELCKYTSAEAALCVNSATSGLMLALHWFGIKQGDEVIIPAYTYCATALAVIHAGGIPILVDIDEDFNISLQHIERAITNKTKVIIPVDIAGWPCDYDEIYKIVNNPVIKSKFHPETEAQLKLGRVLILSDAAHSFGAVYKDSRTGSLADITVFSFHAVKNITTAEGGAVVLNLPTLFDNKQVYNTLRLWTLNGQTKDAFTKTTAGGWKYDIVYPGFKINMPDVCAAIGLAQIRRYDQLLDSRKEIFHFYNDFFLKQPWAIQPQYAVETSHSSCHIYPLRIKNATETERDKIIERITEEGVAVNVHFIPLPMLTVFKDKGSHITDFPTAYAMYCNEISLPVYPGLNNIQLEYVVKAVKGAVNEVLNG